MAIEKLTEFAKTGQKDTDQLDLEVGFIVNRKPARQWFNWLFNTLTTKINEIIDADFMPKSDVVDNLTTDDSNKPVSAKQAKLLQDNKLDANKRGVVNGVASLDENKKVPVIELPGATPSVAGVMKLINDLTTGGTDAAVTAEQVKLLFNMFAGGVNHFRIPNIAEPTKPWIVQFGSSYVNGGPAGTTINLPIAFPNEAISFSAFWIQTAQVTTNVPTYMGNFTPNRAQFKIFTDQAAGNNGTYWSAIGN